VTGVVHRGRVALVTGGARGIGFAVAKALGAHGATIVVGDVDGEAAEAAAASLRESGVDASAVAVDVADEASVAGACSAIAEKHRQLDILVNNAGIIGLDEGRRPIIEAMTLQLWQRTIAVNLTGTFLMCRGAIPLMRGRGWGRIVNISSRVARMRTGPGNAHYAASKAGIIGFSRVLASELGADGITVNCVAPSKVETDLTRAIAKSSETFAKHLADIPMGRLGTTNDVASAVQFLCSDEAGFITGSIIDVTGGSFMP
jgi:3-oxoacyl-[acyl-carrier protein] reductase